MRKRLRGKADSEGPDQTAHLRSLIWAIAVRSESWGTTERVNGEQIPGWCYAHAQDDQNLRVFHMFQGSFLLNVAQMINYKYPYLPIINDNE